MREINVQSPSSHIHIKLCIRVSFVASDSVCFDFVEIIRDCNGYLCGKCYIFLGFYLLVNCIALLGSMFNWDAILAEVVRIASV